MRWYGNKNLFSLSNSNLILLWNSEMFSMNFITFCLHIFKSNDFILFLPYPDISPQPCLQLSRFTPLQHRPLLVDPVPRLQGFPSLLTLAPPFWQHLNSLLVSPWPSPCLHTPSLSWLMEWSRHPGHQRKTKGGREAEGSDSTEKRLEKIVTGGHMDSS